MLASKAENRQKRRFSIVDMYKGFYNQSMKKKAMLVFWKIPFTVSLFLSPLAVKAADVSGYRLFDDLLCPGDDALVCWLGRVWQFSQVAILVLAVAATVTAGIVYMTSAGNPKLVAMAKKIIIGALSAVAVMVLGRFFLVNVVGVEWIW